MSGPWDRPSSDDPDTWPSEDLGPSDASGVEGGRKPSTQRDPGSEGAPGWDDWPAPPPPADDYVIEEPLRPSSDPWAESWTAEEADAMIGASSGERPERDRFESDRFERDRWEAPRGPADESFEPAPDWQPPSPEPPEPVHSEPMPAEPPAPEPEVEPASRLEAWSPDPDPWRFEPVEPAPIEPVHVVEPEPEPEAETPIQPEFEAQPEPEPEPEPELSARPAPVARWPARTDDLPDWLAEPISESVEPASAPAPEAAEHPDPATLAAALEPEAQAEQEPGASETEAGESEPPSVPFWKSILPWRSSDAEPVEADAPDAPEVGADATQASELEHPGEPAQASMPRPLEPRWPASVPESVQADADAVEAESPTDEAARPPDDSRAEEALQARESPEPPEPEVPALVPLTGGLTYDTLEPWPEPDLARPSAAVEPGPPEEADAPAGPAEAQADPWRAPEPEPQPTPELEAEPEPEPEPELERGAQPEPEPEPESERWQVREPERELEPESEPERWQPREPEMPAEPAPAPAATDGWAEAGWSDRGESTRVLPTDWTPPRPERSDELPELSAGAIRTGVADPDADLDEEPSGTIAEQAVPWLIGVILLLAGMVIVLLALIFAGDGSLGGAAAASPSPSPTLTAVGGSLTPVPSPSLTPVPSGTPAPTATSATTPTPQPLPEYGALEMVYQGRSAALAPIYLLRHDFTVTEDPTVLAQDPTFDVRRFAWAPDGRSGAGLLADLLVSIEPGEEKRPLGDGLITITFGEDGSTVYAVRVTEDGTDDVATVLAIDFASGDTEDLASVTYTRPDIGAEEALDEAAFADDGGAVRLFWTADDRLHLWVLGAGAWTIDPADGAVSELDGGGLPLLWSTDGTGRIEVSEEGGTTTLTHYNANARAIASTQVDGVVSHVRWSPGSNRVVFTLGRSAAGGGILQDLFLWDLGDGQAPEQITTTGAAFGAEWLGTQPLWREP